MSRWTTSVDRAVDTPHGPGRLVIDAVEDPMLTLVLGHGAGNGVDTRDLEALAEHLPGHGISVVRFEQPWKVADRKIATAPPTLDAALLAALADLDLRSEDRLVLGGRSAGARSAARCARSAGAAGVLALSFPLHPPGRPERSRLDELRGAGVPTLVVQGERDPMGRPEEFPDDVDLTVVPGADHGMKVARSAGLTQDEAMGIVVEATLEWLVRELAG